MSTSVSSIAGRASPIKRAPAGTIRLRDSRIYHTVCRAVGGAWFLGIGLFVGYTMLAGPGVGHAVGIPELLSKFGLAAFYLSLWILLIVRPTPITKAGGLVPSAVALVGTYLPWLTVLLPRHGLPDWEYEAATGIILAGNIMTLVCLWYLGRSFSLVPQARKLITRGPYALVRHPLYVAEEIMVIGAALLCFSPLAATLIALHVAIQVRRMLYEEATLSRAFPEYTAYQAMTRRAVPGVW